MKRPGYLGRVRNRLVKQSFRILVRLKKARESMNVLRILISYVRLSF